MANPCKVPTSNYLGTGGTGVTRCSESRAFSTMPGGGTGGPNARGERLYFRRASIVMN